MLVGVSHFKGKNIYELIRALENETLKMPKNISIECKNLLSGLLNKDPQKRISWEDFFNNPLISDTDPLKDENKLMEISNLDNFPIIPSVKNEFFSNSFFDKKDNFITSNNKSSFYLKDSDIDINLDFNFNLKDNSLNDNSLNDNSLNDNYSDDDVYYDSVEYHNETELSICEKNNFIKIKNNSIVKDFVVIKPININKKHNFSRSIAGYLSNSLSIIKDSYSYFKNYNSI